MNPLVRSLFQELADLSPAERETVFAQRQIALELRAEVESLFVFDSTSDHALTENVSNAAEEVLQSTHPAGFGPWGPYRGIRLIGAGGMGSVYLAERADGEIQQKVAVKLLRADSARPAWRDRFLNERQFLASLNHPSVARLIDAGHSNGQPYLVMEYVDGVAIDIYAEKLDLRQKLALFLLVCDGVSHAHAQLIIHRDLKPSNILVDASGRPKLLDFGIAKLLDDQSDVTQTVDRLLTPNYASPEHVGGTAETTASDVYSLGAVLYKILTGRAPREAQTKSTNAAGEARETGGIPPAKRLVPSLPADIDYILRKALRSEPAERYASVEAFANEITAFLEWRPVRARSGDAWYRTRKFLRRYWLPVSAAAAAIMALAVGVGVANHARGVAERRFNEVRQLSNKLFDIDVQVRQLPGSSRSRELIVETSLTYLRRLAADAVKDPALALDLGTAYMRVGRVQGLPISPNLGQMDNAEQNLRIAEGLVHSVLEAQPGNRTAALRAAQIAHDRMVLAQSRRPDTEALPLAHESGKWLNRYLSSGQVDESEKDQVVIVGMNVANWYLHEEEMDAGFQLLRRTIDIASATGQPRQAGAAQIVVARALHSIGDLDGALAAIRQGVSLLEPKPGNKNTGQSITYGLALVTEGEVLGEDDAVNLGRPQEAIEYFERGFNMAVDMARLDPNDSQSRLAVGNRGVKLANVLRHYDPERASGIYDQVLRHLAQVKNNSGARLSEVRALAGSTSALRRLRRFAEARQRLDEAVSRLRELKIYPAELVQPRSELVDVLSAQAELEADMGNVLRGADIYQELVDKIIASKLNLQTNLEAVNNLSTLYRAMAALYRRARQPETAAGLDARRVELWRPWLGKLEHNEIVLRQLGSETAAETAARH